ncbi:ABC transporter ATP-binding protein [Sporomusa sp.]|uniref:ABC transporter ATP-binding protein n=1 Tax=Sporomusa sp. TaxID=2078658 RepID=UPI002BE38CB8|nr:ABC transporter ATP-binding protein [Sporomusa sp.]HWR44194.1 ABC transporter ATP-binding protein [Sporomusa sp.]
MTIPMVEMINVTKRFPGVIANDRVSLTINKSEIHALLGENGAGKSTLMSILTGLYRPDEGEIYLRGQKVDLRSPKDAVAHGIGMVHQHFKLIKSFTVAENITLGLRNTGVFFNKTEVEEQVGKFCQQYGMLIDPAAKVWQLSVGEQQRVEILKALFRGAEILILDEPTAVLTPQEARDLYRTLRLMAKQGKAIIVISHKLSEVLEGTDAITVLRGGQSVGQTRTERADEQLLTRMMVGKSVALSCAKSPATLGAKVLELENISCLNNRGQLAIRALSLDIHEGEILGIAGVAGNGQSELAETVAGLRELEAGKRLIKGIDLSAGSPKEFIEAGVSYVPEDRLGTGLVPGLDAVDNYLLKSYGQKGYFINWKAALEETQQVIQRFGIKIANVANPVRMLSGGNLQKLLLAREITADPRLIVVVYPMRGLDVGAMETVRQLLLKERAAGKAILLISEELDELFALSDRLAVLHRGELMGVVDPCMVSVEDVGLMMAGERMVTKHAV